MTDALITRRATNAFARALLETLQINTPLFKIRLDECRGAERVGEIARCDDSTLSDLGLRRSDIESASATRHDDPWTLLRFWQS